MDRLPSDITRNQNLNQQEIQPQPEQKKERSSGPVLRQREKGRDDDESENGEYKSQNALTLSEHSEPIEKNRKNMMPLQLEMRDQERFFFSVQQFYEALEKDDTKELVRMLRHGTQVKSDQSFYAETEPITKKLFDSNKPELLAELIRESSAFASGFFSTLSVFYSASDLICLADFIKAMNDSRDLPKDYKETILSHFYQKSIGLDLPEAVEVAIKLESSILHNKLHGSYIEKIQSAASKKSSKILVMLIENIFNEKFNVKSGVNNLTCTQAAGFALSIDRSDLAIRLQDAVISREKLIKDYWVPSEGKSFEKFVRKSLGSMMINPSEVKTTENDLSEVKIMGNYLSEFIELCIPYWLKVNDYWVPRSLLSLDAIQQSLVAECIRPDLAEVMAKTVWESLKCMSDSGNEDSDYLERVRNRGYFQDDLCRPLLTSQWVSLDLDDENVDELTTAQVLMLKSLGNNYIKTLLGSVADLIDQCFDCIDDGLTLDSSEVLEHLLEKFIFPKSLATFLVEAMDEVLIAQVSKPLPALPSDLKIKEVNAYLKKMLKESASREFKNNFSEIIKQQKLITLFNEDAKGREELWSGYFYAYLDVLKAALPSPKTEH
jgi:hypothetical protein